MQIDGVRVRTLDDDHHVMQWWVRSSTGRASDCRSAGRRFESGRTLFFVSGLRRIEILPSGPRAALSGALVEVFN